MRAWIAGLLVGLLVGCNNHKPLPSITVAEETLVQARDAGYDYLVVLAQAEHGNRRCITSLMSFSSKVDAAGALGHGVAMVELLSKVGDSTFAAVLAEQPKDVQKLVAGMLDAGIDYAPSSEVQRGLSVQAPLTAKLIENVPMVHK